MHRAWSAFVAVALTACQPPPSDTSEASAPIVDGTRELGEPAVVTVETFGGLCSGTLIADNVVLTAKHCVQAPGADGPYPANVFSVGVGDSTRNATHYRARYVDTTPGVFDQDPTLGLRGAIFGVDIGVLILRDPVPDVTPIPIRRDRPDDMVGHEFTAIGFGQRPDGSAGLKYKGTGTLDSIASNGVLYSHQIICSGDSGGPMIQEATDTTPRRVVGVASFGQADSCPSLQDGYNGVYVQLDIIDRARLLAGHCVDTGDEVCDSIDNDCNGEVDEGCAAPGEACTADTDCAYAQAPAFLTPLDNPMRCEDLGAGPVCTRACDPLAPTLGCSDYQAYGADAPTTVDGLYCQRTSGCEGRCAVGTQGTGVDGSACTSDGDCASLSCVDPGDGERRCLPTCRSGDGSCPVGDACAASQGECGACVSAAVLIAPRELGEPCDHDEQCADGGSCQPDPSGSYCTHACSAATECPSGYRCADMVCQRGALATTGEPCVETADCSGGDFCAAQGARHWCTHVCTSNDACPEGLECLEASGTHVCVPTDGLLGESCSADLDCAEGVCDQGVCTRACGATATCPVGFACQRDEVGQARCLPPPTTAGGCSVGHGGDAGGLALLGLGLLGLFARRRSARR